MKKVLTFLSLWKGSIQLSVLAFLSILLFLPHVSAEMLIPTSTPSPSLFSTPSVPPTPDFRGEAESRAREQLGSLSSRVPTNLSRDLRQAFNTPNARPVDSEASNVADQNVQGTLADLGLGNIDPTRAAQGDVNAFIGSAGQDPITATQLSQGVIGLYQDAYNQGVLSRFQVLWTLGVQNPADCSTNNDEGKDLCHALEELRDVIEETNQEVDQALSTARRIRTFVTNKAAFLNTPSTTSPICTGLLTPGPGIIYTDPTIATNPARYNASDRLLSVEAIRARLSESGEEGSTQTSTTDPLAEGLRISNLGASTHSSTVIARQQAYDNLTLRAVGNFKTIMQGRLDVLKNHAAEMKEMMTTQVQIMTALNTRQATP